MSNTALYIGIGLLVAGGLAVQLQQILMFDSRPKIVYAHAGSLLEISPRHHPKEQPMKIDPELASPCGLYCGVCAIYIAHRDNNQKFKQRLLALYQGGVPGKGTLPNSENLSVDDMQCDGCMSDNRFMHCQQCEIRGCATKKGIAGCHACNEFPCEHIENFSMVVGKKVILRAVPYRRKVGTEKWIIDEEARYLCPQCGNKVFRGVVKCNQCKSLLDLD